MNPFLLIAARNLVKNRSRTLLLGGAVASVTLLLVVLLGVVAGVRQTLLENALALSSGHVNVGGFYKISQSSASPILTGFQPIKKLVTETVPNATLILERIKAWGKIISEEGAVQIPVWGVDVKREKEILGKLMLAPKRDYIEGFKLAEGQTEFEGGVDQLANRAGIILFATHARKLKVRVGDTVTLSVPTYRNMSNTKDVRVVAVLKDLGMMSAYTAFMNDLDARELYQMQPDTTGQIMIYFRNLSEASDGENKIRKALSERGYPMLDKDPNPFWMKFGRISAESWTGQKIDVTNWEDETSFIKWILDVYNALTFLLTGILMLIVVLGLVNSLWMSIRERTGEIGTLRAIGLQRSKVRLMFVIEAFLLSSSSAAVGVALGTLFNLILNSLHLPIRGEAFQMFLMSHTLTVAVRGQDVFFTFLAITIFLTLGSLYPSSKASKLKPITAMNEAV